MKKKTLLFLVVLALSLVGCSNTTSSTTTSTDSSSTTSSSDTSPVIDFDINERIAGAKDGETYNLALNTFLEILKNCEGWEESTLDDIKPVYFFGGYGENNDVYVLLTKNYVFRSIVYEGEWAIWYEEYTAYTRLPKPIIINDIQYNYRGYIFLKVDGCEIVVAHGNKTYDLRLACNENLLSLGEMNDIYYQYLFGQGFGKLDQYMRYNPLILFENMPLE